MNEKIDISNGASMEIEKSAMKIIRNTGTGLFFSPSPGSLLPYG
jgi:hypothetical protein